MKIWQRSQSLIPLFSEAPCIYQEKIQLLENRPPPPQKKEEEKKMGILSKGDCG